MSASTPYNLNWVPVGSFHHVGFVVRAIEDCVHSFAESLGAQWDGTIIYDPNQEARVTFLRGPSPADPLFELIEPVGENAAVQAFLRRGGGLHHVCYEVGSLDETLTRLRSAGALVARKPAPAAAFGGRQIAWVYTKNRLLIEYLERPVDGK